MVHPSVDGFVPKVKILTKHCIATVSMATATMTVATTSAKIMMTIRMA